MENIVNILMQATEFLLIFHVMSCLWIRLHINDDSSWIYQKFDIDGQLYEAMKTGFVYDDLDWFTKEEPIVVIINKVYIDAYYFMSTTMSCIGYGDISPSS